MNLSQAVEEIRDRIDIVEYISEHIELKRAGSNYKALCPFHSEKTPSFVVSPSKQIFHCFGCGVGGDLISFVMRYEGLEFVDAVKMLAQRAGLKIQEEGPDRGRSKKLRLLEMHKIALEYFRKQLFNSQKALDYLRERQIEEDSIEAFQLGYAPYGKRALFELLRKKGFEVEEIILSGLCKKNDGEVIDTFRDRLMFPLFSSRGEPIAFGGRIISPESHAPKYLNSPQTILFNKSREVFGLYQAKREISSKDYVILTEGYLDVITTYQQGFKNVIAPLGTALTEAQLRRLSHLTKKVLIVFDSDEAGLKATKRAFSLIYASNMTARALLLPPGEDPDTFLRKRGAEAFRSQFKKVKGIVEFYLSLKGERVEKIKELLAVIKTISDPIIKAELLRELSEKTGISEQYLIEEIGRERKGPKERPTLSKKPVGLPKPEELLIALCIDHPEQLKIVKDSLNPDIIDNPMLRDILKRLLLAEGSTIREHLTEEELSHFSSVSLRFDVDEEAVEKNIIDCVKKIKGKNIRKRLKEIEMEIRMAEKEGDENLLSDLQKRLQETLKEGVNEGLL